MSVGFPPARATVRGRRRAAFRRSRAFRLAVVVVLAWVTGGSPVAEAQNGPAATGVFFSSRPPSGILYHFDFPSEYAQKPTSFRASLPAGPS